LFSQSSDHLKHILDRKQQKLTAFHMCPLTSFVSKVSISSLSLLHIHLKFEAVETFIVFDLGKLCISTLPQRKDLSDSSKLTGFSNIRTYRGLPPRKD
jgi:hypothetical protein